MFQFNPPILDEKRKQAKAVILQHTTGAGAIGFTPIPGVLMPLLLTNQYALLARILYIYNLEGLNSPFTLLIKTALASVLPTIGRCVVGELLKSIPGLGTVAGACLAELLQPVLPQLLALLFYSMCPTEQAIRR